MIYEFALDPRVLSRWETYDRLVNDCGVAKGRLIADFPNRWKKMVWEAVSANPATTPIESQRIQYDLQHRVGSKLCPSNRPYNFAGPDWLEQAERVNAKGPPFRAIVSGENPRGHTRVIAAGELDRDADPRWQVDRSLSIPRTPDALARIARPLFKISKSVRLIDPHFKAEKPRFQNSLKALLSALREVNKNILFVEVHLLVEQDRRTGLEKTKQAFAKECNQWLPSKVPPGLLVHLFRWRERNRGEEFHARMILTDRGGIGIEAGLDLRQREQTTPVYLLDSKLRDERWNYFNHAPPVGAPADWQPIFEPESGGAITICGNAGSTP